LMQLKTHNSADVKKNLLKYVYTCFLKKGE